MKKELVILFLLAAVTATARVVAAPVVSVVAANELEIESDLDLPYDSEVEWIESTGKEWIDTGIAPNLATDIVKAKIAPFDGGGTNYEIYFGVAGTAEGVDVTPAYFEVRKNRNVSNLIGLWPYNNAAGNTAGYISTVDGEWKNITIDEKGWICNGVRKSVTYTHARFNDSLYLFARNHIGRTVFCSFVRFSSFQIIRNGLVICDMVSVRFTNDDGEDEGAMYDRISGRLFCNEGAGAFVIGPDKDGGYDR